MLPTICSGTRFKARLIRGGAILGVGNVLERGLRLIRNMVLARLLAPEAFGFMAIIMAITAIMEAFTEVGIKQSVIQNKRGACQGYLNMAWWFQSLRGIGMYAITFFATPFIANFYDEPELLLLLRVALLVVIFRGFTSPQLFVLEKQFRFGKSVLLVQGSGILATLLTVGLAFYIRNVWALAIGLIFEAMLCCLFSFIFCPFVPNLAIEHKSLSDILKFARGMFGLPILTMISLNTDIAVLGKCVPSGLLGMYAMASNLANQVALFFSRVFFPLLLSTCAEQQNNKEFLCHVIIKITKKIALIGFPLTAFVSTCAAPILWLVYGAQYTVVAVPFSLLSFCILFRIKAIILASVYLGIGQPHLHRHYVLILSATIVSLIYPAIKLLGLAGAAATLLLANLLALFLQVIWMRKTIGLRLREYALSWLPGMCLTPVVFLPVLASKWLVFQSYQVQTIAGLIGLLAACLFYAAARIIRGNTGAVLERDGAGFFYTIMAENKK
jgi:lipopolysaccharide exporter